MRYTVAAVAIAATLLPAAATAGRISRSPYVFDRPTVRRVPALIGQQMAKRFGTSAKTSSTCRGWYPGTHGGVTGWHEIHCTVRVALFGVLHARGTVIYWIDGLRRAQARQRVVVV